MFDGGVADKEVSAAEESREAGWVNRVVGDQDDPWRDGSYRAIEIGESLGRRFRKGVTSPPAQGIRALIANDFAAKG